VRRLLRIYVVVGVLFSVNIVSAQNAALSFESEGPEFNNATEEYRALWNSDGSRIVRVLERLTGLTIQFPTSDATYLVPSFPSLTTVAGEAGNGIGDTTPISVASGNRWFTEDGINAKVFTGSHTWASIIDMNPTTFPDPDVPEFDYEGWVDELTAAGHNYMRLWTWGASMIDNYFGDGNDQHLGPLPWNRVAGFGNAADGGLKFDLTSLNDDYFDRLRDRVLYARSKGMYVSVMLFEGWETYQSGTQWRAAGNVFVSGNNVNSASADTNADGSPYEQFECSVTCSGTITTLQHLYIDRVLDTVADITNVHIEVCNECRDSTNMRTWSEHIVDYVQAYELANSRYQHLVIRGIGGIGTDDGSWISGSSTDVVATGITFTGYTTLGTFPLSNSTRPSIMDTDHFWGAGGTAIDMWEAFTRGHHPIYMDDPDGRCVACGGGFPNTATRASLGHIQTFTASLDLADMAPSTAISSTQYALFSSGKEYLVLQPSNGSFTVNLSAGSGDTYTVTWLRTDTGVVQSGGTVAGGSAAQSFANPFSGSPSGIVLKLDDGSGWR